MIFVIVKVGLDFLLTAIEKQDMLCYLREAARQALGKDDGISEGTINLLLEDRNIPERMRSAGRLTKTARRRMTRP